MSTPESVDNLAKLELSLYDHSSSNDLDKPSISVIESPLRPSSKVRPMAVQSKPQLRAPDRVLFRLNKLLQPTKDLGSVLTTFNYALYLLAYFDHKAHSLKTKALSLVKPDAAITTFSVATEAESSRFARLGGVFNDARLALRLFGLLPIYVKMRQVMTSKGMDQVLYFIAALQCSLYAMYQLLENIAFLTDKGVLSKRGLGRWTGGNVGIVYKIAHRAWFLGIMCDFARLMREAQIFFRRKHIDQGDITQEEAEKAAEWYSDWIRPLAWLPIGWHLSGWTHDGVPGFNLGIKGVAGLVADLRKTTSLWHATKDTL
ncbi:unnamed protein product [Clonostachys byssicola]|uniref:Uncharacterized protein n=1 Tax=Clonostachys byssicola TaxID=160290 RepID=A0A9N9TVY9_9HYPO|nr:unnamed protein product [Clonostachys byssicola]